MTQTKCRSKMKTSKIPWKPFPHDDPSKVGSDPILIRAAYHKTVGWYEAEIIERDNWNGEDYEDAPGWFALVDGPSIPISNITHYCIPSVEVDDD